MASPVEPIHAETRSHPLATRIIDWHWTRPFSLACAVLLVLLAAAYGAHSILAGSPTFDQLQPLLGLDRHLRTNFVLAIVSAYTFGAGLAGLAKATREFDRLRPILRLDDRAIATHRARLVPETRSILIAALIGGFFGAALNLSPYLESTVRQSHPSLHSLPFMILLFGLLGAMAVLTHRESQVFNEMGRQYLDVDLLDPGAFSPFAAVGLLNAGFWFVGSAISSLLVTSTGNMWVVVGVIVVTTAFGVATLILPARGLHANIRERKREELVRIRAAIASERASLFSSSERSPLPPQMSAMLAYESRIESVREWPFDTSTLSRFALFLLIPLVSWIGGALVERAVNAALG
jgi:hypothetical protein